MIEIMNFLSSPLAFAFGAFVVCFSVLLKLLKEERKKNSKEIEDIKISMNELDKKMIHILIEVDKVLKEKTNKGGIV